MDLNNNLFLSKFMPSLNRIMRIRNALFKSHVNHKIGLIHFQTVPLCISLFAVVTCYIQIHSNNSVNRLNSIMLLNVIL